MNFYEETDYRGLEHEIANIVKDVLKHYGVTFTDILRIVARELAIAITDKLVGIVKHYYEKYSK